MSLFKEATPTKLQTSSKEYQHTTLLRKHNEENSFKKCTCQVLSLGNSSCREFQVTLIHTSGLVHGYDWKDHVNT